MKLLLKGGMVVNVFTDTIERANVLIEGEKIIGIGDYTDSDADIVEDVSGKYVCPGFVDGHIHIESTMLQPAEFARIALPHGTTTLIADPHEIVNVAGLEGMEYMLEASEGIPLDAYFMVPSCVPATGFDESGAVLGAEEIRQYFSHPRVLGLGEMMNYPGVIYNDPAVIEKIEETKKAGMLINGHAPMLSGKDLDRYLAHGILDDHECSTLAEAKEKLGKGQTIMIRQGTAAKNLKELLPLFEEPYSRSCIIVSDDKDAADLIYGHIDSILREAVQAGKSPITGIRMASIQAARHFGLPYLGAVAPGYTADLLILDDLCSFLVSDVYKKGRKVVEKGKTVPFETPKVKENIWERVRTSMRVPSLTEKDFYIEPKGSCCQVIEIIPGQILTRSKVMFMNFSAANGIDLKQDILKVAVIERHHDTGHIGKGFITGTGIKHGAIASSVSHDSHNIVVIGTNEKDMAAAANRIRALGGGMVAVDGETVLAELALPIGGLMSVDSAAEVAGQNAEVRATARILGTNEGIDPFMNMSFLCLAVVPSLKLTTKGLIDVDAQKLVPLFL